MRLPCVKFTVRRLIVVVAVVIVLGSLGGLVLRPSLWPSRAVLRGVGDTWPLAFTPDGKVLATAGRPGVMLWDTATGRARSHWGIPDGGDTVMGAFSPDGRSFAAVNSHGPGSPLSIDLRDATHGGVAWSLPARHQGAYAILFTGDGRQVRAVLGVGGSNAGEVVDVDVASGRELARRPFTVFGRVGGSAISPDGRLLATAPSGSCSVTLWDLEADREHAGLLIPAIGATVSSAGFSRDGTTLGVGLSDGSIELWDLSTHKLRTTLRGHGVGMQSTGLQFSPDNQTLASWGKSSRPASPLQSLAQTLGRATRPSGVPTFEVVVLDLTTGERVGSVGSAQRPSFSPDGRMFAVAVHDTSFAVELFDVPGAKSIRGLASGIGGIQTVPRQP